MNPYPIWVSVPGHPNPLPERMVDYLHKRFGKNIELLYAGKDDLSSINKCKMIVEFESIEHRMAKEMGLEMKEAHV